MMAAGNAATARRGEDDPAADEPRNRTDRRFKTQETFGNCAFVNSIKGSRFPKPMTEIDHESWRP
jgi:hypothetical protein